MRIRPIVAYQLSLFGEKPKPGGAWIPPIWMDALLIGAGSYPMGYTADAMRQHRLAFPFWTSFLPAFRRKDVA